jgi:hypothetical protein
MPAAVFSAAKHLAPPGVADAIVHNLAFQVTGIILTVLITLIGIRMVLYWTSFSFQPGRYRQRVPVSTMRLRGLARSYQIPNIKLQFTTKGSPGSTGVIMRGIRQLELLASEDPDFYRFMTVEVVTENGEQAALIEKEFASSPLARVDCVTTPANYRTPKGTELKARQMHYLVELRRAGWNARPGRTFIHHLDEDTLMVPGEMRKLIRHLTLTDKKVLTGPIYYPLEYDDASRLARATEATRPITCFECRRVMETGVPLHVHGSNLTVDEELENRVGWDIGVMSVTPAAKRWWQFWRLLSRPGHSAPFVAEDYLFGMDVFLKEGREVFGWHGAVAWEQPPFSFPTVYKQRYRWVFGVLQGMSVDTVLPEFKSLPWRLRMKVVWGTRYRIATYALGTAVGSLSLLYLPWALTAIILEEKAGGSSSGPMPWLDVWFALVGFMWLGANIMGAWMNALHTGRRSLGVVTEVARAVAISPVAGLMENMAAMSAVVKWMLGARTMVWNTTPSSKAVDDALHGRAGAIQPSLTLTTQEALMPTPRHQRAVLAFPLGIIALAVIAAYIGTPVLLALQEVARTGGGLALPIGTAAAIIVLVMLLVSLRIHALTTAQLVTAGTHRKGAARGLPFDEAAAHARQLIAAVSDDTVDIPVIDGELDPA